MKRSLPTIAWALLGVLVISTILMLIGRTGNRVNPSADSFGPSGASAFAQLLRENGYDVALTASASPDFRQGDCAVVFFNGDSVVDTGEEPASVTEDAVAAFVRAGGSVLALPLPSDFAEASRRAASEEVTSSFFEAAPLHIHQRPDAALWVVNRYAPAEAAKVTLFTDAGGDAAAQVARVGRGKVVTASDGLVATNRFLDKEQNAAYVTRLVRAAGGKRVAFVEAFAPSPPNVLSVLGPWAEFAWYQLLFLFVVIVYSLGKRFGLAELARPPQVGQRQLIDAIADTYQRSRATGPACLACYNAADRRLRKALKLSADALTAERDTRLPPSLVQALRAVQEGAGGVFNRQDAFARCKALRRETDAFVR